MFPEWFYCRRQLCTLYLRYLVFLNENNIHSFHILMNYENSTHNVVTREDPESIKDG